MNLRLVRFLDKYVGVPLCYTLGWYEKLKRIFRKKTKKNIQNILLMKFWGLGNMVLLSPTLRAVRRQFPEAHISFLTLAENQSIMDINADIDEPIYLRLKNPLQVMVDSINLFFLLSKKHFDVVIDFEQFAKISSIFTYLTGAWERVGFATEGQGRTIIYTKKIRYNNNQHMVLSFLSLAQAIGVKKRSLELSKIAVPAKDKKAVTAFMQKNKINRGFICLHPGTGPNAPERIWPKENYAKLADALVEQYGVKVILTGSPREAKDVATIKHMIHHKKQAFDASGKCNIPQLAYLAEQASLFVASDTGPLHLAAAMQTPTISFYGPNTPKIYGPWGKNNVIIYKHLWCSPCMSNFNAKLAKCINPVYATCIRGITVEEVLRHAEKILKPKHIPTAVSPNVLLKV